MCHFYEYLLLICDFVCPGKLRKSHRKVLEFFLWPTVYKPCIVLDNDLNNTIKPSTRTVHTIKLCIIPILFVIFLETNKHHKHQNHTKLRSSITTLIRPGMLSWLQQPHQPTKHHQLFLSYCNGLAFSRSECNAIYLFQFSHYSRLMMLWEVCIGQFFLMKYNFELKCCCI